MSTARVEVLVPGFGQDWRAANSLVLNSLPVLCVFLLLLGLCVAAHMCLKQIYKFSAQDILRCRKWKQPFYIAGPKGGRPSEASMIRNERLLEGEAPQNTYQ